MSRRVVLLGPYPPPYGGVSIYISTLFELLKDRGVELWTYGDEPVIAPNVHFMKDKRRDLIPLLVRRGRGARIADCTHFLIEYPSLLVPLWVSLKALLRFEWLKIMQDGSLPTRYQEFSWLRRALLRLAAKAVTEFIVISEELENWLRDEIHVRQRVSLIKSLFPLSDRADETALPEAMQTALHSYLSHQKRVCSIGVFIPSYGFQHVAEAVERLRRDARIDVGLVLLDGDFAADEAYRAAVLDGREWITVLKNVPHRAVFQVLKRSDAFVRAFGLDSYGLSRVEAIWCGVPVVATRAGETRGMLLYDFGDTERLAAQLQRALFEKPVDDIQSWAAQYRGEAESNLRALKKELGLVND